FRDHTRFDLVSIGPSEAVDLSFFRIAVHLRDGPALYAKTGRNTIYVSVPEVLSKRTPILVIDFVRIQRPEGEADSVAWENATTRLQANFSAHVALKGDPAKACDGVKSSDSEVARSVGVQ